MNRFEAAAVRWVATHASATQRQYRKAMLELRDECGVPEALGEVIASSKAFGPRRPAKRAGSV